MIYISFYQIGLSHKLFLIPLLSAQTWFWLNIIIFILQKAHTHLYDGNIIGNHPEGIAGPVHPHIGKPHIFLRHKCRPSAGASSCIHAWDRRRQSLYTTIHMHDKRAYKNISIPLMHILCRFRFGESLSLSAYARFVDISISSHDWRICLSASSLAYRFARGAIQGSVLSQNRRPYNAIC